MSGYLLCASPRSGSTLLCDLLERSGVAGAPDSFFRAESIGDFALDWGVDAGEHEWDARYVDAVRLHGSGASGRFGMRIMWRDMVPTLERLAVVFPDADGGDTALLRVALGVEHFIHLSRIDRVAEAVSLVIAEQTGLWHRNADGSERERLAPPAPPIYDHAAIASHMRTLDSEAEGWRRWFETNHVEPLALTYEELAADPTAALARAITHIGAPPPPELAAGTAKLATDMNDDWCRRFRREIGAPTIEGGRPPAGH